jgi:hypothetical protein
MVIILISLTLSAIANILLLIYFFSNSSSNSNKEPKVVVKDCPQIEVKDIIGDATDWVISGYYTPNIFDWVTNKQVLSYADKLSCAELKLRLQTSCEWLSKDGKMYTGMPTSDYDGIRIMNKHTDEALVISWSNDDVIVGTWIDKESDVKCIQIIDN